MAIHSIDRPGRRLYILALDHRGSFKKGLPEIGELPPQRQRERIRELKTLIYDAMLTINAR